jgi:polyhydroxybutyrate depolymerase
MTRARIVVTTLVLALLASSGERAAHGAENIAQTQPPRQAQDTSRADGGGPAVKVAIIAARPSAGCSAASIIKGRRIEQTITMDGVERHYILDVPDTLEPGHPAALLFDFHGVGHSGAGLWDASAFKDLAPRERFITVYPTGLPVSFTRGDRTFSGPGWEIRTLTPNRDVDFTIAMLDRLEKTYCIDRARVFSTGFSNGGYFSHVLGCTHPERFAAVAPVSGGWLSSWSCTPSRPIPVLIHHGRQDDVIDVAEARRAFDAWLAIDGCAAPPGAQPAGSATSSAAAAGATDLACRAGTSCRGGAAVEYCEGDFKHRWPSSATQRVWDFLASHPLPPA